MNTIKNGNMWQKSAIQQIMEFNTALGSFKKNINDILESYSVNGNVFAYQNNKLTDVESGYFVIESIHDNLQDAIREINNFSKCIRIVENNEFQVGHVVQLSSEIGDNKAIDIETQTEIIR